MAEHDELARCVSARALKRGEAVFVDCDHEECCGGAAGRCADCGGLWLQCNTKLYSFNCDCGACTEVSSGS